MDETPMEWPEGENFLAALDDDAKATLLRVLGYPDDHRAALIGRLHENVSSRLMADLLIELEEKEWARQWFVERLSLGG